MRRLFLSYAREDAAAVAPIQAALDGAGHDVWVDTTDIRGGDKWRAAIVDAIEQAETVVVILSSRSVASQHVLKEVEIASELGKPLLPARLDDVELSGGLRYTLVGLQSVDLRSETGLHALLAATEGVATPQQPVEPSSIKLRERVPWQAWATGGAAVAAAVGLVVVLISRSAVTDSTTTTTAPPPSTTTAPVAATDAPATTSTRSDSINSVPTPVPGMVGERVDAEALALDLGEPVLALNMARNRGEGCGELECSYEGFAYAAPPHPVILPDTVDCAVSDYSWAFRGPGFLNIAGTQHDEVFWTFQWGNFGYELELPPGEYVVVLRFAEIEHDSKPQSRRFTASVQGLDSGPIDIERTVGVHEALDLAWQVDVSDSARLDVRLRGGDRDCPILNALVIFEDVAG